ncbi:hypothetical protein PENTCL1PPCAC_10942, partial [Pristionchus entomophagus]
DEPCDVESECGLGIRSGFYSCNLCSDGESCLRQSVLTHVSVLQPAACDRNSSTSRSTAGMRSIHWGWSPFPSFDYDSSSWNALVYRRNDGPSAGCSGCTCRSLSDCSTSCYSTAAASDEDDAAVNGYAASDAATNGTTHEDIR